MPPIAKQEPREAPKLTDADRHKRFVAMAREVGASGSPKAFERAFKGREAAPVIYSQKWVAVPEIWRIPRIISSMIGVRGVRFRRRSFFSMALIRRVTW